MTAAAIWALLRRFWPAVPIVGLSIALWVTHGKLNDCTATLRNERAAWSAEIAKAEQLRLDAEKRFAQQQAAALGTYADRLAARQPIILRSTDTVRTYAQTDAGRAACLPADRVLGIDTLRESLFAEPSASAGSGARAVPADADAASAGWLRE